MKTFCFLFVVSSITAFHVAWAKKYTVTATGYVKCYNHRMKYVKVHLMDKDPIIDDRMASGRTNSNGYFKLTGKGRDIIGKPEPYIRVEYAYSGSNGKMDIENWLGKNRRGKSKTKKYKRYIKFGTLRFKSIHCKSYVMFHKAMVSYKSRTKLKVPYGKLKVKTGIILSGGAPYSLRSQVRIPRKYKASKLDYGTAKHELAHTVRHTYDGGLAHFLKDVIKYKYMKHHSCGKKTNKGFAFNEGWAEFWEGSCNGSYGNSLYNYRYEGNVAQALRRLKKKCNTSYRNMVLLLKWYPRKIHSFNSYNKYHRKRFNCKL